MVVAEERIARWGLKVWSENEPAKVGTVEIQRAKTNQKEQKPSIVALTKTVVYPRAVVVELGDAGVA